MSLFGGFACKIPQPIMTSGPAEELSDWEDEVLDHQPNPKRRRCAELLHEGAWSLQDVLTTQQRYARLLIRHLRSIGANATLSTLRRLLERGVVLTSHYSGVGTFEIGASQVLRCFAIELGVSCPKIITYSANEQQRVCQALSVPSCSQHIPMQCGFVGGLNAHHSATTVQRMSGTLKPS